MADPAHNLSDRPVVDAERPASAGAHYPTATTGRSGDSAEQAIDRYLVGWWTVDIGTRHNDLPCLGGSCDGADDGGKCERHQRTEALIARLIRLRVRRNERMARERRARRALEIRLERRHQSLPCHPQDDPCDREHTCWRHLDTDQYVARVIERFERMQGRKM